MILGLSVSLLHIPHKCEYGQKKDVRGISGIINRTGVKREQRIAPKKIGLKVCLYRRGNLLYGMEKDRKIPIIHC
jgi:hypothetical protein